MFFNRSDNNIKFYASIDDLEKNKDIVPYSAKKYIPSWWTKIPNQSNNWPTIRRCPAVPDFFNQGYIVPMWTNILIHGLNKEKTGIDFYIDNNDRFQKLSGHDKNQFLEHHKFRIGDRDIDGIIKFDSPWHVITPKGWSTLVLPVFYEFYENFTILPGIVDTDIMHQMNHPSLLHCNDKQFSILSGTPLLMYIPFKRTKTNYKIIKKNIEHDNYFSKVMNDWEQKQDLHLGLGYGFRNAYRKIQKEKRNDF